MGKENLLSFIELCKTFELEITVAQIKPAMVEAFKDAKLFDLLPTESKIHLKHLFSNLLPDEKAFGDAICRAGIMLLCMSDKRAAFIASVQNAPKESNTIDFVCLNCGNIVRAENTPEKQGCCPYEKYIKA